MRKRFELQMKIGQTPIEDIYINPKSKNSLDQLIASMSFDKGKKILENQQQKIQLNQGLPDTAESISVFVKKRYFLWEIYVPLGTKFSFFNNF